MKKKIITAVVSLGAAFALPVTQAAALAEQAEGYDTYSAVVSDIGIYGDEAENAPASPSVISAEVGDGGLTVKWNAVSGADGYVLYRYSESTGHYKYFYTYSDTEFTWDDYSSYVDGYRYYILSFVKNGEENLLSEATDFTDMIKQAEPTVAAPAKVNITRVGKGKSAIRVYWNPINCAGYEVYMLQNGNWTLKGTTDGTTGNYRVEGLASSTKYTFKIRAFNTKSDGTKVYGEYSDNYRATTKPSAPAVVAPAKVNITRVGKGKSAIRVYWNPINCAGYEVYMLENGNWTLKGTADGTAGNYRVEGLASSTKYTFKIRAFNTKSDGTKVYGEYSDNYRATTKPSAPAVVAPAKVNITRVGKGKTAIRVYWNPINCAGYEVYMLENGNWTLKGTADGTAGNYRVEGLASSTKYTFRIRAFNTKSDGTKVYGEYSDNYRATTKPGGTVIQNGVTYIDGTLIVNKTYSLPSSYNPGGLTAETSAAFKKLQQAAWNDGITLWIASGYRTYDYQRTLYENYVARDGKEAADRYSARPGHSEHQSGLAFDVNNPSDSFNGTAEAKWLEKNCADYGFIIRYPKGKESKTGFQYESWHIRYVGKPLAKKITDSGKCLEEYFGITSAYAN